MRDDSLQEFERQLEARHRQYNGEADIQTLKAEIELYERLITAKKIKLEILALHCEANTTRNAS